MRAFFYITDDFDWDRVAFQWRYDKIIIVIDPNAKSPKITRKPFIMSRKVLIEDKRHISFSFEEIYEMYENLAKFTYRNEKTKTLLKGFRNIKNLDKFKGYETWGFAYCNFENVSPENFSKDCKKIWFTSLLTEHLFIKNVFYDLRHQLIEIAVFHVYNFCLRSLEFPKLAKFHGNPSILLSPGYLVEDILRLPRLLECGEKFRKTRSSLYKRLKSMRIMAILCLRRVIVKPVVKMICQMLTIRDVF